MMNEDFRFSVGDSVKHLNDRGFIAYRDGNTFIWGIFSGTTRLYRVFRPDGEWISGNEPLELVKKGGDLGFDLDADRWKPILKT